MLSTEKCGEVYGKEGGGVRIRVRSRSRSRSRVVEKDLRETTVLVRSGIKKQRSLV